MKDTLVVEPNTFKLYELNVPEQVRNWRIWGKFLAEGGSGNDIEAYVFDAEGIANWKNYHGYRRYYESGKVTAGSFDLPLNPGKYFLVFSNRMSIRSNKVARLETTTEFDESK